MVAPTILVAGLVVCSCSYTQRQSYRIGVRGEGIPTATRVRLAQAVSTLDRLQQLRASARARFGDSAGASIDGMQLEWQTKAFMSFNGTRSERVFVIVSVPDGGDAKRAAEIVAYCAGLIRSHLSDELAKEAPHIVT
jgi:hypothetical protein